MATAHQSRSVHVHNTKDERCTTTPVPHYNYETYYKHQEKQPAHTNALLQYLSDTELRHRNDNLYESELSRLPRRADILSRYIKMNPNFEHLNRVYEPNLTMIEKQRYKRCLEQQQQKLHRTVKKFDFQTADGYNSHYFLTGARYNRFDTVDSKILHKYGTFVNRNNPEQVDIKPSHFKKFREILQAQRRSSTGEIARRDAGYDSTEDGKQEDLDALTTRYEGGGAIRPSNMVPMYGRRHKLPKIKDPARYVDVGSQMPEKKRGRRSVDRAMSSSSIHRTNRHRRQSQHQQQQQQSQQSPAQQSSVSYVANKISFSLVNEPNTSVITTSHKQNDDEYELITTQDSDRHYHHHPHPPPHPPSHHQHHQPQERYVSPEPIDNVGTDDNEDEDADDPVLIEQLQQRADDIVSNVLAFAMEHILTTSEE
ncbi:unnamed protein product [Adineta ricciae]|uniref:Uncharacterized protein n=1 Tax=Adineta ricciae TaxID=249248 RepID=A0A814MVM9_ADIRI|nr:unnamed protein product [Adineta ricciae]